MSISVLSLRNVRVAHQGRATLDVPQLEVRPGETLGIIGPNGSGKSTLLRVLGLLQRPDEGEVHFAGKRVEHRGNLVDYRRRLAIVFQEALLLSTSVQGNVALGLRFRGLPGDLSAKRVDFWLGRLGIGHLRDRAARTLSGGEAQRVSLARALVLEPEVLLLDEPFSALDAPSRISLIEDLERILGETGVTTVFVTHDRGEALALSDRLAVMLAGRVRQVGAPEEVFGAPADAEVAAFVGVETILPGRVASQDDGLCTVEVEGGVIEVVSDYPEGEAVLVCLRPEDVVISAANGGRPSSARNRLAGRITRVMPLGSQVRVAVDCGFPLMALITRRSYLDLDLREGQPVHASFKASAVHLIRRNWPASER